MPAALAAVALGCASQQPPAPAPLEALAESHLAAGAEALARDEAPLAIGELVRALGLRPGHARSHALLAEAHLREGQRALAAWHWQRALALEPDLHEERLALAQLYLASGRYAEAQDQAARLAADATFQAPWRALALAGRAQLEAGRRDEARHTLERALALEPSYAPALLQAGLLERIERRPGRALHYFQRAAATEDEAELRAEARYRMAETLAWLGNTGSAVRQLLEALQAPDGPWRQRAEHLLQLLL